jgi:hypothetical protein
MSGPERAPKPAVSIQAGVAEAVIGGALLVVGKDGISLAAFLEPGLGVRIAGVAVRVVLHRQLAVGGLQFRLASRPRAAQDFIVIARHRRNLAPNSFNKR